MQDRTVETPQGAHLRAPSIDRGPRLSNVARERIAGYLFVAPDAIGLMIFVGGPMVLSLSLGFFSVSGFGEYTFVGLDNYRRMLGDPLFWRSLQVTILYVVALVPLLYVVGLGLALLVQADTRFNGAIRTLLFMPQTVSLVVVALVWQVLVIDKIGLFNQLGATIGIGSISWLGDPRFALGTVIAISVWFLMGFYMLIFLGGLQDIPKEYYEAARIDGAGRRPVLLRNHSAAVAPDKLLRPARFYGDGGVRIADVRSRLHHDKGRPGELHVARHLLHLSAGFPVQRIRLCGSDGVGPRRCTDGDHRSHVSADPGRALHL